MVMTFVTVIYNKNDATMEANINMLLILLQSMEGLAEQGTSAQTNMVPGPPEEAWSLGGRP